MTGTSRRNYVYTNVSGSQILTLLTTDQLVMWPDSFIEAPMHTLFHGVALSLLSQEFEDERVLWSDVRRLYPVNDSGELGCRNIEEAAGESERRGGGRGAAAPWIDKDRAGMMPGSN